ncbi:GNAT family N-acetyltransferase (plasmid) [Photobacterium leiognathi subsp. mandapamensis]|uniref:GNAT family N-acetyltransferase n=1 Tax=Photobacterium leiognathi TaxID=553611 RepID=UPI003AF3E8DC
MENQKTKTKGQQIVDLELVKATLQIDNEDEEEDVRILRYDSELTYDYSSFNCGVDSINTYLHENMERDFKSSTAKPHLAVVDDEVIGFFTLASHAIEKIELKGALKSSCPYRSVSSIIIGKLAVDEFYQGEGMGKWLLGQAIKTAWECSRDVGTKLVVLHAREGTEAFYQQAGFIQGKHDKTLFIYPLKQYEDELRRILEERKKTIG